MNCLKKEGGIEGVLDRYEGPLVRYSERILKDVERARDVVQETFLRLCSGRADKITDSLAAWLFQVCRNLSFDVKKKESRMKQISDAETFQQADENMDTDKEEEKKEKLRLVLEELEKIPENQREVLYLKLQEGLSYKEISRITGKSVSNVGVLIHGGIKKLRKQLQVSGGSK